MPPPQDHPIRATASIAHWHVRAAHYVHSEGSSPWLSCLPALRLPHPVLADSGGGVSLLVAHSPVLHAVLRLFFRT
eukprot:2370357-Heterocapsa_arctica.AAC.1